MLHLKCGYYENKGVNHMNRAEKGGKLVKKSKGIEPPQPKKYWPSQNLNLNVYICKNFCVMR